MLTKVSDVNEASKASKASKAAPARAPAETGAQVGKFTLYCFAQSGNAYKCALALVSRHSRLAGTHTGRAALGASLRVDAGTSAACGDGGPVT